MSEPAQKFVDTTFAFWSGAFHAIPEGAPDGAWFQMHIDAAEHCLTDWERTGGVLYTANPVGLDAYDIVHEYLRQKSRMDAYQ